ncbi:MAG: hypothetical protein ACE5MH_03555 [Terriglobia bacterium]
MSDFRPLREPLRQAQGEEQAPSAARLRTSPSAAPRDCASPPGQASGTQGERCQHLLAEGQRCGGRAWQGSELCFWHHPEATEERERARQRHGKLGRFAAEREKDEAGAAFVAVSELQYLNPLELRPLLARTLARLDKGPMNPGIAYAIGYLVQLFHTLPPPPEPKKRFEEMTPEEREARQRWMRRRVREIYGWPPEDPAG